MIIEPKTRGFICTTAHPDGCAANVREQIDYVKSQPAMANPPKNVLVIGSSTGYGLSSRIVPAFAGGASTVGVFFEKPPTERKTASAGWYNTAAFEEEAEKAGIYAKSFNGDAFSNEIKDQVIATIKADLGKIDTVVYSLASPRRMDPTDGETYKSVLKPIGEPYTQKNLNTESGVVDEITIEPCTEEEIAHTVKVMGGEDWELWMNALAEADVLADGVKTVAYSYIGPELTFPIYTNGTIGKAKEHVEESAARLNEKFGDGTAVVSVNKALVTQASSAIPVVPLYISLLYKVMKEAGNHEGCIEQIQRLFSDHLASANGPTIDEKGRIRIDDWEMSEAVQKLVHEKWAEVNTENLSQISDFSGYRDEFLKLFGFGAQGVDYSAEVNQEKPIISVS
ncbi:trans-2-enoyl-CoA reductase family protein [Verrucomicrobiales bacterium]|nr:trans-2-enoyl-CoA reductase family protein [Verrucomicrobiales bacterium]MDC0322008.1 trans-2-enoyl-CoA reductase family protein [Verrucomicrobiales bacterium]